MANFRAERIAESIHREVSDRLGREVKDPRLAPISITAVKVTRDLRRAVIEYLPLGGGVPSEELVEALGDAARRLRGPIGRVLRIHHAPELVFALDTHTEEAIRVTGLLEKLAHARVPEAPTDEEGKTDEEES